MPNAISMLKSDHATVRRLLRELNASRAVKRRDALVLQIARELKVHSQLEEEVFYPAFKAAAGNGDEVSLFYEAIEEHHLVDIELPKLKSANSKSHEFEARCKVLQDLVEHHIKEEEGEMFVAARQLFSEDQLRDLGELMQQRKETIEAMSENPLIRPVKKLQSTVQKAMPSRVKAAKATAIAKAMERKEAR